MSLMPSEMVAGQRYKVVQYFLSGTVVTTEGKVTYVQDEYAHFPGLPILNLHPHIGMPNILIQEA